MTICESYETPLYNLKIDKTVNAELEKTGKFTKMEMSTDEDEHSIEMHLPYVAKVMEDFKDQFTLVPILVGSIPPDVEAVYGALLAPYLADPQNLFVISSDFCHWGKRFSYTYYEEDAGPIYKSIERLDHKVSFTKSYKYSQRRVISNSSAIANRAWTSSKP